MAMVDSCGMMEENTGGPGSMENNQELGPLNMLMEERKRVVGKMGKE